MSKKDDALEQLRQRKIAMPDVAPPVHDGLWDLPGFAEAREYFHRRGLTGAWVDTVIDPSDKWACFERPGKSYYRSECPAFEGFWLDGGSSAETSPSLSRDCIGITPAVKIRSCARFIKKRKKLEQDGRLQGKTCGSKHGQSCHCFLTPYRLK